MKNIGLNTTLAIMALAISCQVGAVQVLYPSISDFHTPVVVPHESIHNATFDNQGVPLYRGTTIPPHAAPGLEHLSNVVVPAPRFTTHSMITTPSITTTTVAPTGIMPTERPTVITTDTYAGSATVIKPHEVEPHPRGSFTRFITTVPVTSYSDELPVTVIITVNT